MAIKDGFAFVFPEYLDVTPAAVNIHIFVGKYNTDTETFTITRGSKSLCGQCKVKKGWKFHRVAFGDSEKEAKSIARKTACEYEDGRHTVCGVCVSTLYNKGI